MANQHTKRKEEEEAKLAADPGGETEQPIQAKGERETGPSLQSILAGLKELAPKLTEEEAASVLAELGVTVTQPDPNFGHVAAAGSKGNAQATLGSMVAEAYRKEKGIPKVEAGADAFDKQVDGFGDVDFDPLGVTNPMLAVQKAFQKPGMQLRLMSEFVVGRNGTQKYQVVKDGRGDPVKVGKMTLAEIPDRFVEARKKAVQAVTNEQVKGIKTRHQANVQGIRDKTGATNIAAVTDSDETVQDKKAGITVVRAAQNADRDVIFQS